MYQWEAGVAFRNLAVLDDARRVPLYFCVGLHSAQDEVEANFGLKPFVFDMAAYMQACAVQFLK